MNIENEKKWFVYIGDHHEGPFTPSEIQDKKNAGLVTDESYVWCEGMADWVMLTDAKDLANELKRFQKPDPAPATPSSKPAKVKGASEPKRIQKKSKLPLYLGMAFITSIILGFVGLAALSRMAPENLHAKLRPTLNRIVDRVPALAPLFHLIPTLTDVSPEEQLELEQAPATPTDTASKVAIALSVNDPNRPFFYVSTNLPDHTKFDVYIIGNPETLLNKLQFSAQNSASSHRGFGKTDVFLADGGQLIPKGEYKVIVTESQDQDESVKAELAALPPNKQNTKLPEVIPPNVRFVTTKIYFLGGARDETYLTRLKQFHEKIKSSADHEVQELKQYSDTLNSQYSALTTEFTRIYQAKKITPALKQAWKKDVDTWQQINGQLEQTIQTWSKETIRNEFFYGKVYALTKNAYDSIKTLFQVENSYVETPVDHATFDVQHGKILSETRDALELLRTKMDAIVKAPRSPSGLPTREGL